jgi:transketolase
MTVINPCDYNQTKAATKAIAEHDGPVYLRFGRPKVANFTPENQTFEIGKAVELQEGSDVTIVATGHLVWEALEACKTLAENNISAEVIDLHTIKPLDEKTILESIEKTGCVVTAEEHNYFGGMGESIARTLTKNKPVPQEFVAVNDSFGESGKPAKLMEKYHVDASAIIKAVNRVVKRKNPQ